MQQSVAVLLLNWPLRMAVHKGQSATMEHADTQLRLLSQHEPEGLDKFVLREECVGNT